jgi:hypothetical protein
MQPPLTFRCVVLVAALAASAATVAAPAQAAKPKFVVTAAVSATNVDVGQKIKVSGAVRGSGAAKKTVRLERRVGRTAWKTVASAKTNSKGKYAFAYALRQAGAQSFRVVAPKNRKRATGASPARTVTGWRWLDLTREPWSTSVWAVAEGGASVGLYATNHRSERVGIRMSPGEAASAGVQVGWRLRGCKTFKATFGIENRWNLTAHLEVASKIGASDESVVTAASDVTVLRALDPDDYVAVQLTNPTAVYSALIMSTPRAHCSADKLEPQTPTVV